MKCKTVQKKLNAYLDAELTAEASRRVEEHFRTCPDCARELAHQRRLRQLLDLVPGMKVPVGFARSVCARAARGIGAAERKIIPLAERMPAWVRVAAMVAIVVSVTAGAFMSNSVARMRSAETVQVETQPADLLSAVPPGGVAEAYLELIGETE